MKEWGYLEAVAIAADPRRADSVHVLVRCCPVRFYGAGAMRALSIADMSMVVPSIEKLTRVVTRLPRLQDFAEAVTRLVQEERGEAGHLIFEDVLHVLEGWRRDHRHADQLKVLASLSPSSWRSDGAILWGLKVGG